MLEFLTVLPQECEDAAAAAQSGTAEGAFQLKQRVGGAGYRCGGGVCACMSVCAHLSMRVHAGWRASWSSAR